MRVLVSTCLSFRMCHLENWGGYSYRISIVEFYYSLSTLVHTSYLKACALFCPHLKRNLLDIFWNENFFEKKLERDEWNTQFLSDAHRLGATLRTCPDITMRTFSNLKRYLFFPVLGKIFWKEFKYASAGIVNKSLIEILQFLANIMDWLFNS